MNTIARLLPLLTSVALSACETSGGCDYKSLNPLVSCTSSKPQAAAGPDQRVVEGDTVELTNFGFNFSGVSTSWTQLGGPEVSILGANSTRASFTAPPVDVLTALEFRVTAKSGSGKRARDRIIVEVEPTSDSALCLEAPLFETTFVWFESGCTASSISVVDDTRKATLFRQVEVELNGYFSTANPLHFPLSVSGEPVATSVNGVIGNVSADASDFFVFSPNKQGDYQISFCNDPVACTRGTVTKDWNLVVYDHSTNRIANTNPGALYERKLMLWLESGSIYYIAVFSDTADRGDWAYNLTIMQN